MHLELFYKFEYLIFVGLLIGQVLLNIGEVDDYWALGLLVAELFVHEIVEVHVVAILLLHCLDVTGHLQIGDILDDVHGFCLLLELGAVLVEFGLIHKLQLFVGLLYCEEVLAVVALFGFE